MPSRAGNLLQLLKTDLVSAGWNPGFTGPLQPRIAAHQYAMTALRNSLLKKFNEGERKKGLSKPEAAALALFLRSNEDCRDWIDEPVDNVLRMCIGELKSLLYSVFHPPGGDLVTFWKITEGIKLGPGANVGHTNVDFYSKLFNSCLTTTSVGTYIKYVMAISHHPLWSVSEYDRFQSLGLRIVEGSVLNFAWKNATIARVICAEPTLEMLFQQGIADLLTQGLDRSFGIDLTRQQEKNARLARIGSISGRFATADLKSASDRNSMAMIRSRLPPTVTKWLEVFRSPRVILPNNGRNKRRSVELHMVSSMGNAFTFPLQTILFTCMVLAVYRVMGIKPIAPRGDSLGNYGVFGDDIICLREAFPLVVSLLQHEGHIVNQDKSFSTGPFRESCGHDYYDGHDVRGVYIENLNDVCDYYSAINRLNLWSAKHEIPLPNSVRYLVSQIPHKYDRKVVPMHEAPEAGIRVPLGEAQWFSSVSYDAKWGAPCWRYEFIRVVDYKVDVRSESHFRKQVRKSLQRIADGGQPSEKDKYLAFHGVYRRWAVSLCAVAGKFQGGSFVIREFRRRTSIKAKWTPGWDSPPPEVGGNAYLGAQLLLYTSVNLGIVDGQFAQQ